MNYLSVCSGIEAATCAWHPLGWTPEAVAEVEPFPSAVLAHHYPDVPNLGDMTKFKEWNIDDIDLLVGGTPCQSFSVAGLRKGLDDPRGNLCLTYLAIAERFSPRWLLWENVPGVLSSGGGRDFGSFLGALAQLGYGWAYRILDAQYFGVPQRRRRVFVVGYLGDWRRAAAVLFERHSLSGHPPPSREKRKETPGDVASRLRSGGDGGVPSSRGENLVTTYSLPALGTIKEDSVSSCLTKNSGSMGETQLPALALVPAPIVFEHHMQDSRIKEVDVMPQINAKAGTGGGNLPLVLHGTQDPCISDIAFAQVRRLTPKECERLQGFPDDYTNIPWRNKPESPDGPRYKALGNSMAVPVMRWIGERIKAVDSI